MRFLIWLVVLFWVLAMLRRVVSWMLRRWLSSLGSAARDTAPGTRSNQRTVTGSRRLVRDPVCGVHIAEDRSLPLRVGDEVIYFCSAACRDKYTAGEQKYAASG